MSRSNELKTGLWRIYCPKRGKLAGLGFSYLPKTRLHFKELGRRPFWILLMYIEVIVGPARLA
jgi:hypothetical protein